MSQSEYANSKARNQKRIVGIVSIVLITLFFILSFAGYIPFLIMLILDLIVWGIANFVLRRIGRTPL